MNPGKPTYSTKPTGFKKVRSPDFRQRTTALVVFLMECVENVTCRIEVKMNSQNALGFVLEHKNERNTRRYYYCPACLVKKLDAHRKPIAPIYNEQDLHEKRCCGCHRYYFNGWREDLGYHQWKASLKNRAICRKKTTEIAP